MKNMTGKKRLAAVLVMLAVSAVCFGQNVKPPQAFVGDWVVEETPNEIRVYGFQRFCIIEIGENGSYRMGAANYGNTAQARMSLKNPGQLNVWYTGQCIKASDSELTIATVDAESGEKSTVILRLQGTSLIEGGRAYKKGRPQPVR